MTQKKNQKPPPHLTGQRDNPSARLQKWRLNASQEYVLPSGNTALLKRVGILDLAQLGQIPDTLSGQVSEMAQQEQDGTLNFDLKDVAQFGEVIDLLTMACFVDPLVTKEGDENHLAVSEVPSIDKIAVFAWANDPAAKLQLFRPGEQDGDVHASSNGGEIRSEAIVDSGS